MLVPSSSLRTFLEQASINYNAAMPGSAAEEYLVAERGISPESIERFHLGFVAVPEQGHERYKGYLAIPYLTPDGSVTSIRFRRLGDDGPKYLTAPGDIPRLYNAIALTRPWSKICITEGELDAITAEQCGIPAIGVPGAYNWHRTWKLLLRQYDVVYVLCDDDKAGEEFGQTVSKDLDNARVVTMTGGDVNAFVLANGCVAFKRKVSARVES